MKKKPNESEQVKAPEQVSVPPISETAQSTAASSTPAVETVSVPPITESTAPAQPPAATEKAAVTEAPAQPKVETISAPPIETTAPPPNNVVNLPPPGRGSRTFEDYQKLDWTKTNAELAEECGVSRQAISQMRKKVSEARTAGNRPTFDDLTPAPTTAVQQVVDYDLMASSVFDMSTGILTTTFGPEWQPRQPEEKQAVVFALKTYFQSKQVQDLPPGLMLTAVVIAYAAPRLREPNTASKIKMGWTWLKMKLASLRKKKA